MPYMSKNMKYGYRVDFYISFIDHMINNEIKGYTTQK
jgi:hypothetical protein